MNEPIKQHYVPQVYLRYFARKRNKIWEINVKDKKQQKSYKANVRNIAFEKNYYTIERFGKEKYVWEKYYAENVEPLISKSFTPFIQRCSCVFTKDRDMVIDEKYRVAFSEIIATQLLRTPKARAQQYSIYKDVFPTVVDNLVEEISPSTSQKEWISKLRADELFKEIDMTILTDTERIKRIAQIIYDKYWIVYRNNNHVINPFVTSDHPIVQYNTVVSSTSLDDNGIAKPQTIIHFPINSQLILALYDSKNILSQFVGDMDGKIVFLDNQNDIKYVKKMNELQYEQCTQHVFFRPFH